MQPRWSLRRARVLVGTKFMLIAGLVGFVLVTWLVEVIAGLRGSVTLPPLAAAVMAGIPAVLWLGFFYLMDRHEPEPKQLVAGVCVLGALVAAPLANFAMDQLAPPLALEAPSFGLLALERILYAVFVVGLTQEVCKYAVVRYTIYPSREFDEPMDGIVYMMACGTGFAVWGNYHKLASPILLSTGAATSVVTTLAHASFAGVLGYVMGRAKFSRRSAPVRSLLLMCGLLAAATLNGAYHVVNRGLQASGASGVPIRELGIAAVFAAAVFGAIWVLSQGLLARSPFKESA
ncbi:MAG TPA: PrsW family glutamic-type intramembrane protease [Kofleriaceae bacterium]|jgi:RsiW-degrading membrane proteinase PrsW (M82 family)